MEEINIDILENKEVLNLIIKNNENDLSEVEFRELRNLRIAHIGDLNLKGTHYTLYENKHSIIAVRASESLYKIYKEVYFEQYPTKTIRTIRDLKNFIKDVAEKEGNKSLHKQARNLAFDIANKYSTEVENQEKFIYKDGEFKPKGSD